tara:strand:+ start:33 stop:641 length:609 start_codon:yes stop_codon:yes gene_type:complete
MTTKIVRLKTTYSSLIKSNINKVILLFITTVIFSCQTNPQKMEALVKDLEEPVVISEDVEWFYTKNGLASHRLTSPKVLRFEGQKEYIEFPLGLEVFSFNVHGEEEAFMKSDYAIKHLEDKTIEAKGGVLLENIKGEKLETEFLVWDEKRGQIFTEALVKITKQGQLIIGEGFESNTSFSKYTLKNSRGIINLDQAEQAQDK